MRNAEQNSGRNYLNRATKTSPFQFAHDEAAKKYLLHEPCDKPATREL
jgi:poly(3-hydroxybutyrate) depolymerase